MKYYNFLYLQRGKKKMLRRDKVEIENADIRIKK